MAARAGYADAEARAAGVPREVWVAAAGALVALVAYALPWFTLGGGTYNGISFAESPPQAPQRGAYILVLAALTTLVIAHFWRRSGVSRRHAMLVLAAGVLGLLVSLTYLLTALLQPALSAWVSGLTQGTPKPNANLFGLGELQGLGPGLLGMVVGFLAVSWAGWSGAQAAGALAVEAPAEEYAVANPMVRRVVVAGLLGAIAAFLGATRLGFIPFPTGIQATIMHVPAIIGGIAEGWPVGWAIGTIFGLFSFLTATNPLFADPRVAILPRMFIGITAYFTFRALRGTNYSLALVVSAVVGTLTNTILVLTTATLLHPELMSPTLALTVAFTNGIPEAIIAAIIVLPIMDAVRGRGRARRSTI